MRYLKNIQKKLSSFKQNENGGVAILTALSLVVLIGVAGISLDYARMINAKAKIEAATDSAVLAVGKNFLDGITDEAENRQVFEAMLQANLQGIIPLNELNIVSFNADPETGEVSADIDASLPATLTGVFGFEKLDLGVSSSAIFEQSDVEIALVLDNTGSMRGSKMNALKGAAEEAIEILIPADQSNTVRIGLVPYSASVNVGRYARRATRNNDLTQVASTGVFTPNNLNVATNDCVTERGGPEAATDASFADYPVGSDSRTVEAARNTLLACPNIEIRPLTNEKRLLLRDINRMGTSGATAGHIGISWAYYMLSENWSDLWPNSAEPTPYADGTKKVAIIMTDGVFNTFYNGTETLPTPFNQGGVQQDMSENLALDLCENMKAERANNPGILIYSIAFEAPAAAQDVLQECATEDTSAEKYYHEADNAEELSAAFAEIAKSIQSLRLSQ